MSKPSRQKERTFPALTHGLVLTGKFKVILLMFLSCLLFKTSRLQENSQNTGQVMPSPENKKRGKACAEKVVPESLPGTDLL